MFSFRTRVDPSSPQETPELRRHGRLLQKLLHCNIGQIVDLSANGMRIRSRKKSLEVDQQIEIVLTGLTMPAPIFARVVWIKRAGLFGGYDMGMELINTNAEAVRFLAMVASTDIRHLPYNAFPEHDAA